MRTEKWTAGKKALLLERLRENRGFLNTSLREAGVSATSYYNWRRVDPVFLYESDRIQDEQIEYVEKKLLENIDNNDTKSIIFYLKTKGKSHGYEERSELKIEGDGFEVKLG